MRLLSRMASLLPPSSPFLAPFFFCFVLFCFFWLSYLVSQLRPFALPASPFSSTFLPLCCHSLVHFFHSLSFIYYTHYLPFCSISALPTYSVNTLLSLSSTLSY